MLNVFRIFCYCQGWCLHWSVQWVLLFWLGRYIIFDVKCSPVTTYMGNGSSHDCCLKWLGGDKFCCLLPQAAFGRICDWIVSVPENFPSYGCMHQFIRNTRKLVVFYWNIHIYNTKWEHVTTFINTTEETYLAFFICINPWSLFLPSSLAGH